MTDKVLVTGALGHLGITLMGALVQRGYKVRAGVRSRGDDDRLAALTGLGVEIVEADLLKPETLRRAMKGMAGVFQVAAVYSFTARNPAEDVIRPSVEGVNNVMAAAREAGIERVILTSSTTAVGSHAPPGETLSEKDWNLRTREPYAYAKTQAELAAREYAREHGLTLVSLAPAAILGPNFLRHTPSTLPLQLALTGGLLATPPLAFSFVDVRDVAEAHIRAYEVGCNGARYVLSSHYCSLAQLFALVQELEPEAKIPRIVLPSMMLPALPVLDWLSHQLLQTPRFATRAFVSEFGGKRSVYSSKLAEDELGWKVRPFRETVWDTLQWVKERQHEEPKARRGRLPNFRISER